MKNNKNNIRPLAKIKRQYQLQIFVLIFIALFIVSLWIFLSYFILNNNLAFNAPSRFHNILLDVTFLAIMIVITALLIKSLIKNSKQIDILNSFLASVMNSTNEILVFTIDRNYHFTFFNNMYRLAIKDIWDKDIKEDTYVFSIINHPKDIAQMKAFFDQAMQGESFSVIEQFHDIKAHNQHWQNYYSPIFDTEKKIVGCTCFSINITTLVVAEQKSKRLSYIDPLTNLYNRRYFDNMKRKYDDKPFLPLTVIITDVNGLKFTNDVFGHSIGDILIKDFAEILRNNLEPDNIICRIGGDEFAVLMPNTDARTAAEAIRKCEYAISQELSGETLLSVSFGSATKTAPEEDLNQIQIQADSAMYHKKIHDRQDFEEAMMINLFHYFYENNPIESIHAENTSRLSVQIGQAMGLEPYQLTLLENAGYLHDIGKITFNYQFLSRNTPTSKYDWQTITQHCEAGYKILSYFTLYHELANYVLYHHEHVDGEGYPAGLSGDEIPLLSKIIAVANNYDAMITKTPYYEPVSQKKAIASLIADKGTMFDPKIVDILINKVLGYD